MGDKCEDCKHRPTMSYSSSPCNSCFDGSQYSGSTITKTDGHTINSLLKDLKFKALHYGRYPTPYSVESYDNRDKSAAFRCMGFNRLVRQINALERLLK